MSGKASILALLLALSAATASTAAAAAPLAEPAPASAPVERIDPMTGEAVVTSRHEIVAAGRALAYVAEAGRIPIRDAETGEPHGFIFYTAYRVASPDKPRPVTFVWNGGPGADSSTLHFHVAGPRIVAGDHLADNPDTWLADTDLVFVDPVGTGFSRPARRDYADEFYGTVGDVASVTEFVRDWLLLHDAERAPLFLVGESWGAGRAASVGYALEHRGRRVSGLVLISGGSGLHKAFVAPELAVALHVADLAETALYWGRTPADLGKDPAAIRAKAEAWARRIYAPALAKPDALTETERAAVVAQLSRFTGLPADQIDPKTLKISPRQYRTGLLKAQGKALDVFDMRLTAEPADAAAPAILDYLRRDLGYRTDLPYVGLESLEQGYAPSGTYPKPVGERWNYATAAATPEVVAAAIAAAVKTGGGPPVIGPPLPATAEAAALDPRLRVLVAAGRFDSLNSCSANDETARALPSELARAIAFRCYAGGHMMYRDAGARMALTADVKAMIAGGLSGGPGQ